MRSRLRHSSLLPPRQQTLVKPASFEGVGLHTGDFSRVTVAPAEPDAGISFIVRGVRIPATADFVGETTRCTTLTAEGVSIHTVEHLLAALYALGVDNAEITMDGVEPPALDGSALPFAEGLLRAGVREQDAEPHYIRLSAPVWVQDKDRVVAAIPGDHLTVAACVDFNRPYAGPQSFCYSLEGPHRSLEVMRGGGAAWGNAVPFLADMRQPEAEGGTPLHLFLRELAPARTFCFEDWIAAIRAAGLGGGGSLENTVVLGPTGTSTPLRFVDELARHKTLDLLGDLALVGGRLQASVIAVKAGHLLHVAAAAQIRRMANDTEHPGDLRQAPASLPLSPG